MLHLLKLAVGARDVDQLRGFQRLRLRHDPPLRHQTRSRPTRAAELLAGGSLYWVVAGFVQVRQRIVDVREDRWDDGSSCTGLVLDPQLVGVVLRPQKPFQGWRYLPSAAAPEDASQATGHKADGELPPALRAELRTLGLL